MSGRDIKLTPPLLMFCIHHELVLVMLEAWDKKEVRITSPLRLLPLPTTTTKLTPSNVQPPIEQNLCLNVFPLTYLFILLLPSPYFAITIKNFDNITLTYKLKIIFQGLPSKLSIKKTSEIKL